LNDFNGLQDDLRVSRLLNLKRCSRCMESAARSCDLSEKQYIKPERAWQDIVSFLVKRRC
jgi:hypothetical protein